MSKKRKNNNCCIVIPIYKDMPSETEIISLRQCCKILFNYQIIFITNSKINISFYSEICSEYKINALYEYFPYCYSVGIYGYNALLLSKRFYRKFDRYEYMLLYHLDAYVFRDELGYWCDQNYDYIGAPWLTHSSILESPKFGGVFNLEVGNGGFCLRKIQRFVNARSLEITLMYLLSMFFTFFNILKEASDKFLFIKIIRYVLFPLKIFLDKIYSKTGHTKNEDLIWVKYLQPAGNIPPGHIAMRFSTENYCDYLYKLSNNELPFGCHGWSNYFFYNLLWKNFINIPNTENV